MRRLAPVLAACLLAGCAGLPADGDLAARVDALLAPRVAAREFSGAVVLTRRGEVVYERGFGMANHEAGVPFTPDTPTDGGSLAKPFTAAGVWWLAQEGRIDLDAPVTRYLPGFPHAATTVRQLVTHTNGLPPYYEAFDPHFAPGAVRTTQDLLGVTARIAPQPAFTPGTRFEYSNLGFDAAALVIERVTGLGYEAFLRQRFFAPLGMTRTFARPARFADWPGVRTMGYEWKAGAWQVVDVFDGEGFLGASNLYFSASDLSRWARANAAGAAVPPEVLASGQQRPAIDGRPSHMTGLSWYCDDARERCYYTGSLNAFHGLAYWDRRRDETVVMVANSSLPPWRTITLQRDLVAALSGIPARPEPERAFQPLGKASRPGAAGTWVSDATGPMTVSLRAGDRLRLQVGAGLAFDMFQVSPEVFYVPGPDWWVAFAGGERPAAMHVRGMFVDAIARRLP